MFGISLLRARHRTAPRRGEAVRRLRPTLESLEGRQLLSLTVQYDYSLDSRGFFSQSSRRALLEGTINAVVARLGDSLGSLPSHDYTFEGASGDVTVTTAVPADTLKLYVMGKPLGGSTAGLGGSNTVPPVNGRYRGQSSPSDYAPAVSAIRFDDDGSTNWYFGASTTSGVDFRGASASLDESNFDFVSCVRHEFLHCLGFYSNPVFVSLTRNGGFIGANAEAANHSDPVPLSGFHIADSLASVMNPATDTGVRRDLTAVEWGMLQDLGWNVVSPPGFYRKYDLLTAGEDGEVQLDVVPSRGVYLMRIDALNGDRIVVKTSDGATSNLQGVDTYLKLFDDQGNLLASNDDASGSTTKSELSYTVTRGGTFYVGASTYGQRAYTFTIPPSVTASSTGFRLSASIAARPDPTPDNIAGATAPAALATDIRASLNQSGDQDFYRIDAVAGRVYTISTSLAGGGLPGASILSVYDASGHKVAGMPGTDGNSEDGSYYGRASFTAATTGPYFVAISRIAGPDTVDPNQGLIGEGWGFASNVDGYAGEGEATSANDYVMRISETIPPPSGGGSPGGGSPGGGSPGGTSAPSSPPAVTGVAAVAHARGRKIVSITLAYDRAIDGASAANKLRFGVFMGGKGRRTLTVKAVRVARTALGSAGNEVVITLARPTKGPLQVVALPGVRGSDGLASISNFVKTVS